MKLRAALMAIFYAGAVSYLTAIDLPAVIFAVKVLAIGVPFLLLSALCAVAFLSDEETRGRLLPEAFVAIKEELSKIFGKR